MDLKALTTAEKVTVLMKRLDVKQYELAEHLGVSKLKVHYSLKFSSNNDILKKALTYLETLSKEKGIK